MTWWLSSYLTSFDMASLSSAAREAISNLLVGDGLLLHGSQWQTGRVVTFSEENKASE
jgi:hypothetical protein